MTSDNDKLSKKNSNAESRPRSGKPWQPMKLTYSGEAKDVVQGGTGKISPAPTDPGDVRKVPAPNQA
jgi:hypothetical protein